jgi:hypothetical protein
MKRGGYKFGTFMHWVFFKPTASVVVDDPAQVHNISLHMPLTCICLHTSLAWSLVTMRHAEC